MGFGDGHLVIEQLVHPDIAGGGGHRPARWLTDHMRGGAGSPVAVPPCWRWRAVVLTHQIEGQAVQSGGGACRGDQPIVIHVEGIGIRLHREKAAAILFVLPVGRCLPEPLSRCGIGEHQVPRQSPNQPGTSGSGGESRASSSAAVAVPVVTEGDLTMISASAAPPAHRRPEW